MKPSTKNLDEILKSLKQQVTPWNIKIKYVHQIMDINCQFPSKNHIILEWACQELVFNSKNNCYPEEMLTELWQIITEMLKVMIAEESTSTVLLRPSFIEVLVNEFQSTQCPKAPLVKCCKVLFATPELYRSSAMKYEKFVQFLKSVLKFVPVLSHMTTSDETVVMHLTSYFELIEVLLQLYMKLQKQQANLQKVAIGFNEKLLQEIAVWNRVISKFDGVTASPLQKIHSKEVLRQTLWNSETMSGIRGHAHLFGKDEPSEDNASRNFAMLDSLFSNIEASLVEKGNDFTRSAMLEFIPELFQTFLTASSESKSLPKHFEFTMFRQFCTAVLKSEAIVVANPMDSTLCFCQLLRNLLNFRVFLVIDETVNTDKNRRFLHSLTERILQKVDYRSDELTVRVLSCLEHLVEIDLSLLEHQLEEIIKGLLASGETSEGRSTLKEAKGNLLGVISETYSKGRRSGDFVKVLISAVLNCDKNIDSDSIFLTRMKNAVIGLPVGQSLSIINLLLEDLRNNYISSKFDLQPDMISRKFTNTTILKISFLSTLLSIFFNNVHILPSNGYHGVKQECFVKMVGKLKEDVILPLVHVFQEITDQNVRCNFTGTIWQFINTFQSLALYLIDHGFVSSPLLHVFNSHGELLLPSPSKDISVVDCTLSENWLLYVEGLLFYARQLIITADTISSRYCFAYIEELIAYFAISGGEPKNLELKVKLGGIFLNEMPWLGGFISKASMGHLCSIFFNAIGSHVASDGKKLMQNLQLLRRRTDPDKIPSKHKSRFEENTDFLAQPYFYDSKSLQIAFCDCLVQNISMTNVWTDISVAFERFIDIADINETGIVQMEVDALLVVEGHSQSAAGTPKSINPTRETFDTRLSGACNDVLKLILGLSGKHIELRDDENFCQSKSHVELMPKYCKILEAMNMMIFEWLIASSAAKLLLLILLIGRKSALFENGLWRVEIQSAIFYLLEKFTGSTIVANRMAVWKVVDPVLLLKCVLSMIHDHVKEQSEVNVPHHAYQCAHNLWILILRIKRNKVNDEVFNKLKNEMLQMTEEMSNNLSLMSVKILNTLLFGTLETLQARVVKKQCLVTASQLTFPIMEKLLSVNLGAILNKYEIEIYSNMDHARNGQVNEYQQIYYNTLRCYGYVCSICLQMKSSGKDQSFMSMLRNFKLEDLISKSGIAIQKGLHHMKTNVSESDLFSLQEEVCLEYLNILYGHKDCAETLELRSKDFCEQLFACLISIMETKRLKQLESRNLNIYFEILAYSMKVSSCDVAYGVIQLAYRRLVSVMYDSNLVEVSLELLDYLFSTTYTKDKKKSIANLLPKVLYLLLDIVVKTVERSVLSKAFKSLVSLLAFSKDILAPVHASAALHCILNPARSSSTFKCCLELLQIKVKLLSVLLFNHTNAMIGAIASFGSAVDSLLQEFAILNKPEEHGNEDVMKACNGISRLYKEIASHKDSISELDRSDENPGLIRSVLTRLYRNLEWIIPWWTLADDRPHRTHNFARYFLADYLRMIAANAIQKDCQKNLSSGIYCLMDICPSEDFAFLNNVLPQREQDLFKDLHSSFTKHHKFQGKT